MWADPLTDSETPHLLGLAHFLLYDPDRALSMFDACLSRGAGDQSVPQQRLDCLYWSARAYALKAALAWYSRHSILDGVIKSRRAIMVALDLYEQVLAQAPGQLLDRGMGGAEAVLLRRWVDFAQAEVAFLDQDFPAAVAYTNAYLSQVPDGAEGYALKGACLKFLGQQEAGEVLINKARELNP